MISVQEAKDIILSQKIQLETELCSIDKCIQRVTSEDIYTDRDYPPFNRSAMDGIAINIEDYENGIRSFEIQETIYAGQTPTHTLNKGQCYKIMTGASVPAPANCVVRIEDVIQENEFISFTVENIKKNQNIAQQGEDKKKNELIIKAGTACTPTVVSLLATLGKSTIKVKKTPSIGLISTGDEIKQIDSSVNDVQIRDSNSYALKSFLDGYSINPTYRVLLKDDKKLLLEGIQPSLNNNITIISGGVSAGDADFVPAVLKELGVKELFHKVKIKPGKPLWFGITHEKNVVFALPGNPISVQVAFKLFIEPFIRKILGLPEYPILKLPLYLERSRKVNLDEYFPCNIINSPQTGIMPSKINGSGDISASFSTDGIALHPQYTTTFIKNDLVDFIFWNNF